MLWGYKVSVEERTGKADITLSFATSCSTLWIFFTSFGRRKSYANAFLSYPFVPSYGFYTPFGL